MKNHILKPQKNFFKKIDFFCKNLLTNQERGVIISYVASECHKNSHGSIAQLGEHLPYKQRVIGSSPVVPTSAQAQM